MPVKFNLSVVVDQMTPTVSYPAIYDRAPPFMLTRATQKLNALTEVMKVKVLYCAIEVYT